MSPTTQTKTERIDVRLSPSAKALLREAAKASYKNVSEFILEAGIVAANQALAERRLFLLDKARWNEFQEVLDRPVQKKPRLSKLLNEPGVLD